MSSRQKPPLGTRIDRTHPMLRDALMLVTFNGDGNLPYLTSPASGTLTGQGPTIHTFGSVRPRAATTATGTAGNHPIWAVNNEGVALHLRYYSSNIDLGEGSWIPTKNVTICCIRRTVSTAGSGDNWGFYSDKTGVSTFGATLPYPPSGNAGFGFGSTGSVGTGGLWTNDTNKAFRFVMTAGDAGMKFFVNGVRYGSSSTPVSRTAASSNLLLNGNSGKSCQWNQFLVLGTQWHEDMCRWWSSDPWAFMEEPWINRVYLFLEPESGIKFKINGTDRTLQPGFRITEYINERNTMSFKVLALDASWRPVRGQSVLFKDYDTPETYFAGYIHSVEEGGFGGYGTSALEFHCQATDHNTIPDWREVEYTIQTGDTLKDVLTDLVDLYLDDYGVTLDASQVTGPTMSTLIDENLALGPTTITDILNQLQTLTETYVWRIDYDKVLSMYVVGTTSVSPPGGFAIRDIKVNTDSNGYCTFVRVRYTEPATKAQAYIQLASSNFTNGATVTLAGRTYTWETTFTDTPYYIEIGSDAATSIDRLLAAVTGGSGEGTTYGTDTEVHTTVELTNDVTNGSWEQATVRALTAGANGNSLTLEASQDPTVVRFITEGSIEVSSLVTGTDAALTGVATATTGAAAADRRDRTFKHEEVTDAATAQSLADSYLTKFSGALQESIIITNTGPKSNLAPGISFGVSESTRNISSGIITQLDAYQKGTLWFYELRVKHGETTVPESHLAPFREWTKAAKRLTS